MKIRKCVTVGLLLFSWTICSSNTLEWESSGGPPGEQVYKLHKAGNYLFASVSPEYNTILYRKLYRMNLSTEIWERINLPTQNIGYFKIAAIHDERIFISLGHSGIGGAYTDDFGESWNFLDGIDIWTQIIKLGNTLYTCTNGGRMTVSTDNGNTWTVMPGNLTTHIFGMDYLGGYFIGGTIIGVVISADSGQSWDTVTSDIPYHSGGSHPRLSDISDVKVFDNILYLACEDGIFHSTDTGKVWQYSNAFMVRYPGPQSLKIIDNGLYTMCSGKIYKLKTLGEPWENIPIGQIPDFFTNYINLNLVLSYEIVNDTLYLGAKHGAYKVIIPDKSIFTLDDGMDYKTQSCVWRSKNKNICTGPWGISTSADEGNTWYNPLPYEFSNGFAASTRNRFFDMDTTTYAFSGLNIYKNIGTSWTIASEATFLIEDMCVSDTIVFAAYKNPPVMNSPSYSIAKSTDIGKTWDLLDTTVLDSLGSSPRMFMDPNGKMWIWRTASYIGELKCLAYSSEDFGKTFTKHFLDTILPDLEYRFLGMAFLGKDTYVITQKNVYTSIEQGAQLILFNDGINTSFIKDFVCRENDIILAAFPNFFILRSGATQWEEIITDPLNVEISRSITELMLYKDTLYAATDSFGVLFADLGNLNQTSLQTEYTLELHPVKITSRGDFIQFHMMKNSANAEINIFNVSGQLVFKKKNIRNNTSIVVNMTDFASGIYIARVAIGNKSWRQIFHQVR